MQAIVEDKVADNIRDLMRKTVSVKSQAKQAPDKTSDLRGLVGKAGAKTAAPMLAPISMLTKKTSSFIPGLLQKNSQNDFQKAEAKIDQ